MRRTDESLHILEEPAVSKVSHAVLQPAVDHVKLTESLAASHGKETSAATRHEVLCGGVPEIWASVSTDILEDNWLKYNSIVEESNCKVQAQSTKKYAPKEEKSTESSEEIGPQLKICSRTGSKSKRIIPNPQWHCGISRRSWTYHTAMGKTSKRETQDFTNHLHSVGSACSQFFDHAFNMGIPVSCHHSDSVKYMHNPLTASDLYGK